MKSPLHEDMLQAMGTQRIRHAFTGARWVWALGLLAVVALTVGVAGTGCGKGKGGAPGAKAAKSAAATPVSVVIAKRGSIREELELTGTCTATDESDVVAEVSGKVVSVRKDVGDFVRAGEPLVQLDTALVSKQRVQAERGVDAASSRLRQSVESARLTDSETSIGIRQAEAGVAAAQEQLRKAEASSKYTQDKVQSDIEQAKVALASAEAQERDVAAGARTQEIAQAEAAVRKAESDLALKKSDYDRYERLCQQGAVSAATLDAYRTQYEVATQNLSQAREALSLAREGSRAEQRRIASLAVERAREQLKLAEAGRQQVDIAARDVQTARVSLRQAQENLRLAYAGRGRYSVSLADINASRASVGQAVASRDLARTTQGKYTIVSPITGTVASRNVEPGEAAMPTSPVMRIVNLNPIRVEASVTELDIEKVKLGDEGVTTVDGLPGREFLGRVVAITPQTAKDQRNYTVRLEIDNSDGVIKAGMFARVRLVISEHADAVVITRDCLVERGTDRKAYIVDNGVIRIRDVKIGITNANQLEVLSGVDPGQMLVCAGQAMLADGQQAKPVVRTQGQEGAGTDPGAEGGAGTAEGAPSPEAAAPAAAPPAAGAPKR